MQWGETWPQARYGIIYADPPWPHWGSPDKMAAAGKHYSLMSMKELSALPVKEIMVGSAALFMWATCPRLDLGIELIKSWGLYYRGVQSVWVKCNKQGQIIHGQGIPPTFTKPTTELLLAATTRPRGRPFKIHTMSQPQVVLARRGAHSSKPAIFRDRLVELCGDIPRVELFAREAVPGWDAWGNEVPAA